MTLGTVVVEAAEGSGTRWTVYQALEQNREVFCVPGSIFSPASRFTNRMIKEGAKLVADYTDILEELNLPDVAQSERGQVSGQSNQAHSLTETLEEQRERRDGGVGRRRSSPAGSSVSRAAARGRSVPSVRPAHSLRYEYVDIAGTQRESRTSRHYALCQSLQRGGDPWQLGLNPPPRRKKTKTAANKKAGAAAKKGKATTRATTKNGKSAARGSSRASSAPRAKGKDLVIVESPAKARTVGQILGNKYVVTASQGHLRDLPQEQDRC